MHQYTQTLIWDVPIRLFHWMLTGGFFIAAFIAFILEDDSRLFPYHAVLGLIIAIMTLMRIIWGFTGSRYARFSSFAFGPKAVLEYINGIFSRTAMPHIGHNPGSAWAIFTMLALLLGLTITGLFMNQGGDFIEEAHEFLANAMIFVVTLHILGVLFHMFRHRENIVASMLHGRKAANENDGIASPHLVTALIFLVISLSWSLGLTANYDRTTKTTTLPILGITVQLGEVETKHESKQYDHGKKDDHHDKEDD